ncbi:MAG: hypothetical protein Q7T20_01810 [Saprospiraceae bacterium]|nr:hypothetical protein [Saprospiraceae bacterium]
MKKIRFILLFCGLLSYSQECLSQFWKDAVKTIAAPITAPTQSTINILRGDDPKSAILSPWEPAGRVITKSSNTFQKAQDVFNNVSGNTIENTLGSDWRKAYETLTASQRVQFELTTTSGRFLGKCLQGGSCNINELVAGPLAASLRDAYKVYYNYSYPLPPQVVNILSTVMPREIAAGARWAVGNTPNFSVPGFLNYGNSVAGDGHAVTIGNIMIFSEWPNLNTVDGWEWLLHELHHFEQYKSFDYTNPFEGIDGFAVAYIKNHRAMENAAENVAFDRVKRLR